MLSILAPLSTLFLGTAILVAGHGLLTTLIPIRIELMGSSPAMAGAIAAGYFFGLVVGAWYNPQLIHNVGRIRALSGFAAIFAATSLLLALAPWPLGWILIRAIAGACLAGLTLVIESWLNSVAPAELRGRVLAIYMIVFYGALGAGQFLLSAFDPAGFELFAIAAILLGMSLVPIVLTRTVAPEVTAPMPFNLKRLFRVSPLAVIGAAAAGIMLGCFYGLAPLFSLARGLPSTGIALFMSMAIFGGLALQWPIGMLSDRIDRRSVIIGTTAITACLSISIALTPRGADELLLGLVALFGGFSFTIYPLCLAHAGDRLSNNEDMVGLSSGMLLLYSVGAAVGPLAAGFVFEILNGGGLFLLIAVVAAMTVIFSIFRVTQTPAPSDDEQVSFVAIPRTSAAGTELDPRQNAAET